MPGQVIKVKRSEKLGVIERLYIPMIVQGLAVTARHFFRNLRGFVTGKNRQDFVVQYPDERIDYPDAFRGMPVLVQLDNGQPRCVACGLCEFACPTDCISIVPGELEGARIERYPEAFDIDMSRCMFCGLVRGGLSRRGHRDEPATSSSRASTARIADLRAREDLLVAPSLISLKRRLDFLRAAYEYDRVARSSGARRRQQCLRDEWA